MICSDCKHENNVLVIVKEQECDKIKHTLYQIMCFIILRFNEKEKTMHVKNKFSGSNYVWWVLGCFIGFQKYRVYGNRFFFLKN